MLSNTSHIFYPLSYVLDLTFSNIPFAQSAINASIHSGSDYKTIEERQAFKTTVRQAKRQYWRHVIDNAKDDKDLFKIIAWHKLTLENQDTPLIVNNRTISDPLEKAEALREEVLNRYTAEDDLGHYPDQENADTLPWSTHISLEETERNTVEVSSTSLGTDRSTVRLLRAY
ncbi:putative RNA-directed DNA polymerase from transposon X-element [Stemphylium lycopersici]|nr:putative RNA-directed DNA polymerase from transposon X-element [Stemphylium lycopersici]